jgi:hypothetical protein
MPVNSLFFIKFKTKASRKFFLRKGFVLAVVSPYPGSCFKGTVARDGLLAYAGHSYLDRHAKKFFEFGLLLTKLGRNIAHLALEFAYFHSAPSPIALFFIAPLLLQRLVSFPAFSYNAYFHFVHSYHAYCIVTI